MLHVKSALAALATFAALLPMSRVLGVGVLASVLANLRFGW